MFVFWLFYVTLVFHIENNAGFCFGFFLEREKSAFLFKIVTFSVRKWCILSLCWTLSEVDYVTVRRLNVRRHTVAWSHRTASAQVNLPSTCQRRNANVSWSTSGSQWGFTCEHLTWSCLFPTSSNQHGRAQRIHTAAHAQSHRGAEEASLIPCQLLKASPSGFYC